MPNRFAAAGKCKRCGSNDFVAPDNATDESWITCDNFGQIIMTWKEFKTVPSKSRMLRSLRAKRPAPVGQERASDSTLLREKQFLNIPKLVNTQCLRRPVALC